MNGTVSRVITFIISVVIACILASVFITYYHSGAGISENQAEKTAEKNDSMKNAEYEDYDGIIVKGTEVIRLIRMCKDISINVQKEDKSYYPYNMLLKGDNTLNGGVKDPLKTVVVDKEKYSDKTEAVQAKLMLDDYEAARISVSRKEDQYIEGSQKFIGHVLYQDNGSIAGLAFERTSKSTTETT